mgnify:CR=1 FL=1
MAQLGKIPATVITGFLGAGKTTMIRNMLENADGKRIALIINEFGDLGVDRGDVLAGHGVQGPLPQVQHPRDPVVVGAARPFTRSPAA